MRIQVCPVRKGSMSKSNSLSTFKGRRFAQGCRRNLTKFLPGTLILSVVFIPYTTITSIIIGLYCNTFTDRTKRASNLLNPYPTPVLIFCRPIAILNIGFLIVFINILHQFPKLMLGFKRFINLLQYRKIAGYFQ